MGKKGHFDYAYNGQISVDQEHQIIVGQHVSQQGNDSQEVEAALASLAATMGRLPDKMSLDNGYMSGANLARTIHECRH
jgi:transposase